VDDRDGKAGPDSGLDEQGDPAVVRVSDDGETHYSDTAV
jgi:hypothetical protein